MIRFFIALIMLVQTNAIAVEYAWWLTYKLSPKYESLGKDKASDLNNLFATVELLSCDKQPTFTEKQCKEISNNKFSNQLILDLNQDGKIEQLDVGIAKTIDGELYRFLVIRDFTSKEVIKVFKNKEGLGAFSMLYQENNKVYWFMCMECGVMAEVKLIENYLVLDWGNEYG